MSRFTEAAGRWAREQQAAAVIVAIQRAPDRAAALTRLQDKIDDQVIGTLADLSYAAWRDENHAESRKWADLAVQASLLGGTSSGRADALTQHVTVTLDEVQLDGSVSAERLQAAETAAREAMTIYAHSGQADERIAAQLSIARLREATGDILGAFDAQLSSARLASESADPGTRTDTFRMLCPLYWGLPKERQRAGAELLVRDISTLVALAADRGTLADLLYAAGDAYRRLGDSSRDAAFETWTQAAAIYRDLGDPSDEFLVRSRMLRYAVQLGENALARELGEACVAAAPPDVPPEQLADNYHILGSIYCALGQSSDAVTAYRQAITLHLSYAEGSGAASTLYLELGLLEADDGRYDDARRDLESVTSGGSWDYWLMETTLADISYRHLGDLGGAIGHAESALQLAISMLGDMLCRACSLRQEAVLRAKAGDMETAYQRLSQLMPILERYQLAEPILIRVSPHCARPVALPGRAECAWLACQVSQATGRHDEAKAYRQMHTALAGSDPVDLLPAEVAADLEPDDTAALQAVRELKHAMSLMPAQPKEAMAALARAHATSAGQEESHLAAQLAYAEGSCYLLLRDYPTATAAFKRALAVIPDGANANVRMDCHQKLAFIAAASRRYTEAYGHLRKCTDLIDKYRSSLPRVEDRMAFLRDQIPVHELLVISCIALNLRAEAFNAIQRVKSRSLADLLAQSVHQPIDYDLEDRATLLRAGREDWVAEYLADTPNHDFRDPEEYRNSRQYQMLADSIERRDREKSLASERHARGLLEELHEHASQMDYAAAKELLRI